MPSTLLQSWFGPFSETVMRHSAWLFSCLGLTVMFLTSAHAILYKRDSRAAAGWAGITLLTPMLGGILYWLLGINRIRRKAKHMRNPMASKSGPVEVEKPPNGPQTPLPSHLTGLAHLMGDLTRQTLTHGNRVEILIDGDQAYPAMLAAIDHARESIGLATYIFNHDAVGLKFVAALHKAVARGVAVRVLVDCVGARYSAPSIIPALRQAKIPVARFLPLHLPGRFSYFNLRNHRKIIVVDGRVGFTGGLNIQRACLLQSEPAFPVRDIHFRLQGPVVGQLCRTFAEDWRFAAGESLSGKAWFPAVAPVGRTLARGINDGPDEDFEKLRWTLLGALNAAKRTIAIVTPYFVPDQTLIACLNLAAMRGVKVDIVLPDRNNLALVKWASNALLWQVLEKGCRVWTTEGPFDHAKLMVVDGFWSLFGSANWDARSLRLNFEFNVETYDTDLAARLEALVVDKIRQARRIRMEDVDGRNLPIRLRDGLARLFSPYL